MFNTSQSRWRAVETRCEQSRSAFVYAVLTTRIYCRPTCPARLARRANVVFYDNAAAAKAVGFRPCKRCRPEVQPGDGDDDAPKKAVEKACKILGQASQVKTVNELANAVHLSPRYFHSVFKKVIGMTPREYTKQIRLAQEEQRVNDSQDAEGCRRSAEDYFDSWLRPNSHGVEDDNSGILRNDFATHGLFSPLAFDYRCVDGGGHSLCSTPCVWPGNMLPQSDGPLSSHDGSPLKISSSDTAWLAHHNLSASCECSSDHLSQFPSQFGMGESPTEGLAWYSEWLSDDISYELAAA